MVGGLLALSLTACATHKVDLAEQAYPPPQYLEPCSKSILQGDTNADLLVLAEKRGQDIDACNDQLLSIRDWVADMKKRVK
jgi:hypothetical protein